MRDVFIRRKNIKRLKIQLRFKMYALLHIFQSQLVDQSGIFIGPQTTCLTPLVYINNCKKYVLYIWCRCFDPSL